VAGCNPKKIFVRASEVLQEMRDAGEHGVEGNGWSIDWQKVWERKHRFTDPVSQLTEKSLASAGVELVRGDAQFLSPETIRAGGSEMRASGFVVATGSHPRGLKFPGANYLKTTNDILELQKPPRQMVIVGSGVVAFEFGQIFARLGTRVSVAMRTTRALANFDDDFVAPLVAFSEKLGIEFIRHAQVEKIEPEGDQLCVHLTTPTGPLTRPVDLVLNAAGRVPAVESLDLSAAGVEVGRKGVIVDRYLRSTTNRRVFAGGDAHGEWQLSPVASYEGRLIARNFVEGDVQPVDYSAIPHVVFTVPPLAGVGLTEAEARAEGRDFIVKENDMTNWQVFAIAGSHLARAKVLLDKNSKQILGAQLLGEGAAENIHLFTLAMRANLTADYLRDMMYVYPTFASSTPYLV
jgi:glutathione reductase (NADPH)